jgi:hypothetical protein
MAFEVTPDVSINRDTSTRQSRVQIIVLLSDIFIKSPINNYLCLFLTIKYRDLMASGLISTAGPSGLTRPAGCPAVAGSACWLYWHAPTQWCRRPTRFVRYIGPPNSDDLRVLPIVYARVFTTFGAPES